MNTSYTISDALLRAGMASWGRHANGSGFRRWPPTRNPDLGSEICIFSSSCSWKPCKVHKIQIWCIWLERLVEMVGQNILTDFHPGVWCWQNNDEIMLENKYTGFKADDWRYIFLISIRNMILFYLRKGPKRGVLSILVNYFGVFVYDKGPFSLYLSSFKF